MSFTLRALAFICALPLLLIVASNPAAAGGPAFINRTVAGSNSANASSWLAGAHAGYNWQQGAAVFGFETDFQGLHLSSSMNGALQSNPPPLLPGEVAGTNASIDWYGTFRGRLGTTFGSFMAYITAGVAYGNVELTSSVSAVGLNTVVQVVEPRIGGVGGFGFEYILKPNVMLIFAYQYVDLGRVSASSSTVGGPFGCCALGQTASVHAQFQTAMIGFSYRFAPDGSSSPWAGGYGGLHGGGAWGNNTNALYNGSALLTTQ